MKILPFIKFQVKDHVLSVCENGLSKYIMTYCTKNRRTKIIVWINCLVMSCNTRRAGLIFRTRQYGENVGDLEPHKHYSV
jgi:hypothetical protein